MKPVKQWACISTVSLLSVLGTGCTTFDPYIKHYPEKPRQGGAACMAGTFDVSGSRSAYASPALGHACTMLYSLEHARSQNVRVQSGMVATLIPLAGLVGYKAGRTGGGANTAALAAGGLSLYAVGTTLAQPDRLKIYDAGLTSVSCAIGVYATAANGAPAPTPAVSQLLQAKAADAQKKIADLSRSTARWASAADKDTLRRTSTVVALLSVPPPPRVATQLLEAQLRASVEHTINQVNTLLSNTVPAPNAALANAFGTLSSYALPAKDKEAEAISKEARNVTHALGTFTSRERDLAARSVTQAEINSLMEDVRTLTELYVLQSGQKPDKQTLLSADFSPCAISGITATTQLPYNPLTLGPGDSANNKPIVIERSQSTRIDIFGGIPPYRASVAQGPFPRPEFSFPSVDGAMWLEISLENQDLSAQTGELQYQVMVTDATGRQAKQLTVVVPAVATGPTG